MHTGRIGHEDNLPGGEHLVSSVAVKAAGHIFTETKGLQDHSEPIALTTNGVKKVIAGHVAAARNAIKAGFDGVELHVANGCLIEQFLNPNLNTRNDEYGDSVEARAKFEMHATYTYLAKELGQLHIAFLDIGLSPEITDDFLKQLKETSTGTFIICNELTPESAKQALITGRTDLTAFGRSFLANPDLPERIALEAELTKPEASTYYTPGSKGYTDYQQL